MQDLPTERISGRFWRSVFFGQEQDLLTPAKSPRGRWHYGGQDALYLSGSPEGCRIALKVYLRPEDPPRGIFPIAVNNAQVVDLRKPESREAMGTRLDEMHVFWAEFYQRGVHSPTWSISDALRIRGIDGLLTPSRSRPDQTHLTLFQWNRGIGPTVKQDGAPEPF